jgi:hypothetical protein
LWCEQSGEEPEGHCLHEIENICRAELGLAGNQTLPIEELTRRFYEVKRQRDNFGDFCAAVCPANDSTTYDAQSGRMFRELMQKDKGKLIDLLKRVAPWGENGPLDRAVGAFRAIQHHHDAEMMTLLGNDIREEIVSRDPPLRSEGNDPCPTSPDDEVLYSEQHNHE